MAGVFFGLRGRASSLESHARGAGSAVACGHGDELHEIEGNVFIAAGADRQSGYFSHEFLRWNIDAGNVFHVDNVPGPRARLSFSNSPRRGGLIIANPFAAISGEQRGLSCQQSRLYYTVDSIVGMFRRFGLWSGPRSTAHRGSTRLSHITGAKKELTLRINRIQGQLDAIRDAIQEGRDCASVLQQVAACRGAINGLMAEIVEGEIKCHVLSPNAKANSSEVQAADQLVEILRRYLK